MNKIKTPYLLILALLVLPASGALSAEQAKEDALFGPYETIRQALLHDHMEGVGAAAKSLAQEASSRLTQSTDPEDKKTLAIVTENATKLVSEKDLASARETYYEISKALVRYRETLKGDRPVVVYCSMAKKSWLQPKGEIGNPYYGQSMAKCGEVVSRDEV